MSRRARKPRQIVPTVYWDWSPEIAAMFNPIIASWTPPRKVRVSQGRKHVTISARFMTDRGFPNTARLRLERAAVGPRLEVVEQSFAFSFSGRL